MSKPGNAWRRVHGMIKKKPTNFSWIIDGKLAGSGIPTTREEFDWILEQKIQCVITMTEKPLPDSWTQNIEYLHLPTVDLTPPLVDDIDLAMKFIDKKIKSNQPVMVHCAAGLGRAGTILTCYLVTHCNYSAKDAINEIRLKRPGSVQSESQEEAIYQYEKKIR